MTTVLLIEDNEDNRVSMGILLRSSGFTILEAENGISGYKKAINDQPDLVLMDIQLPDIDGTEVLRRLKLNEQTRKIPVIAVTSYAMSGDRQRFLAAGFAGYIEKPIDPPRVVSQIKNIMEKHK
ncbi:MAG: response regulator [Candidatus Thiodiazotropha taylori]|nr:response regulator [Candidatus Thiodiazotropha taylori]MCW4245946.1 response regulator [Candidatus Thiodiazotropha taylori]